MRGGIRAQYCIRSQSQTLSALYVALWKYLCEINTCNDYLTSLPSFSSDSSALATGSALALVRSEKRHYSRHSDAWTKAPLFTSAARLASSCLSHGNSSSMIFAGHMVAYTLSCVPTPLSIQRTLCPCSPRSDDAVT